MGLDVVHHDADGREAVGVRLEAPMPQMTMAIAPNEMLAVWLRRTVILRLVGGALCVSASVRFHTIATASQRYQER